MKRFVKNFYCGYGDLSVEKQINNFAKENNLKIITITALYQGGIYVLFEERECEG
jgi:hypothetical protein